MKLVGTVLIIVVVCVATGADCALADYAPDDLQSVAFDEYGIGNNSLDIAALLQQQQQQQQGEKDVESARAQRVNRKFEKMIQLVNILGQVDSFLSERTKLILRKLALLAEDDDGYYRRRRS